MSMPLLHFLQVVRKKVLHESFPAGLGLFSLPSCVKIKIVQSTIFTRKMALWAMRLDFRRGRDGHMPFFIAEQ